MSGFPIEILLTNQSLRDDETLSGTAGHPDGVPHVAIGIWLATILVLVLPSPGPIKHKPSEYHLLRAYGVVMSTFPLLR